MNNYIPLDMYVVVNGKIDWKATRIKVSAWVIAHSDDNESIAASVMEVIDIMENLHRIAKKYGSKAIVEGKKGKQ